MQGKVTVIAFHRAKPGKEEALRKALIAVCAPTRAEKGCLNYDLHASPDDPCLHVFHENWESEADLDAHLASPHIDAFRAIAPDLLAEPPDITRWYEIKE
ncbi:MAG: putative quinol monooxygenase [Methyloceanibacter sp.]|uniref:putative quinol monooxygenase n=1 Tax=Methyloceanibacter sp. TaxID=1965321 RepID=UPI003D6DA2F6